MEELRKQVHDYFEKNDSSLSGDTEFVMNLIATHEKQLIGRVGKEVIGKKSNKYTRQWNGGYGEPDNVSVIKPMFMEKGANKKIAEQRTKLTNLTKSIERGE